ncbi:hypothetical protein B0H14DRAFT_2835530, partial [Mycena olivaceomarginata]
MLSCRTPSFVTPLSLLLSDMWPASVPPLAIRYNSAHRAQRLVEKTRNDTGSSDDEPLADWIAMRGKGALDGENGV